MLHAGRVPSRLRAWWQSLDETPDGAATTEGAAALVKAVKKAGGGKSGSLSVYGDIFGGRVDNVHHAIGADVEPEGCALIRFDDHETLRVVLVR